MGEEKRCIQGVFVLNVLGRRPLGMPGCRWGVISE
jgi:hypothetical protein